MGAHEHPTDWQGRGQPPHFQKPPDGSTVVEADEVILYASLQCPAMPRLLIGGVDRLKQVAIRELGYGNTKLARNSVSGTGTRPAPWGKATATSIRISSSEYVGLVVGPLRRHRRADGIHGRENGASFTGGVLPLCLGCDRPVCRETCEKLPSEPTVAGVEQILERPRNVEHALDLSYLLGSYSCWRLGS